MTMKWITVTLGIITFAMTLFLFQNCGAPNQISTADTAASTSALLINPTSTTVSVNKTQTFAASGGTAPYTYSATSGCGYIDPSSGNYTAPASVGTCQISAQDKAGNVVTAIVTVQLGTATSLTSNYQSSSPLVEKGSAIFTTTGGSGSYTYSVSYTNSLNPSSGVKFGSGTAYNVLTLPNSAGTVNVTVQDTGGLSTTISMVIPAPTIQGNYFQSCTCSSPNTSTSTVTCSSCQPSKTNPVLSINYGQCPRSHIENHNGDLVCGDLE